MNNKESFSLKFFIIPQPDNIHAKIFLRITVDRKKVEIYTGSTIRIDMWDETAQQAKSTKKAPNTGINEDLLKLKDQITDIKRRLKYDGKPITAKIIKDIHTGAIGEKHFLLEYFNDHITQLEKLSKEYSKGTIKNYRVTYNHLQNFIISKKLKDIELLHVDTKFINDFDFHLMTYVSSTSKSAMDRNSANRQHKRLKAVLSKGMKEGILDKDPYNSFKIKDNTVNRNFLTEEEIELLKNHDLGNNVSLKKVRDIFLFSIYTGLRFGDASQLKTNHVYKDSKGQYWIEKIQGKTKEMLRIPMFRPAVEIMQKYDNEERKITDLILPKISNQKVNAYLKTITDLVGIQKKLTHHIARHTFATTITLSNDVPLEIVSKMMGHTNIRTTQPYAKITIKYLSEVAIRLDDKLK